MTDAKTSAQNAAPKNLPRSRDNAKPPRHQRPFKKNGKKGKKGKKHLPPRKRGEPVFAYLCLCHDQQAKKKPCEWDREDRSSGKFSEMPLGTWHCTATGKKCKVRRVKLKVADEAATTAVKTETA